jgi:hypothetical protein
MERPIGIEPTAEPDISSITRTLLPSCCRAIFTTSHVRSRRLKTSIRHVDYHRVRCDSGGISVRLLLGTTNRLLLLTV